MADIITEVAAIRTAILGKDVRESLASGIEGINTEVKSTTTRQDIVDANEVIRQSNETTRVNEFDGIKTDYTSYKNVMIAESNVAALQNNIDINATDIPMQQMFPQNYSVNFNNITVGNFYLSNIPIVLGTVILA